jgi:hypothetical protein
MRWHYTMMTNEEMLAAFGEFLGSDPVLATLATFGREKLVAAVREFDPVPLAQATNKKMDAFVRDHSRVEDGSSPAEQLLQKQRAQIRRYTYEAAMLTFKHFRREVLKKR